MRDIDLGSYLPPARFASWVRMYAGYRTGLDVRLPSQTRGAVYEASTGRLLAEWRFRRTRTAGGDTIWAVSADGITSAGRRQPLASGARPDRHVVGRIANHARRAVGLPDWDES